MFDALVIMVGQCHGGPRLSRAFEGLRGLGHTQEKEETNRDGSGSGHSSVGEPRSK